MLKETKDGFVVGLKISPNAKKNEILKNGDTVKVKIAAQPVDEKANKLLIEFLSKKFKIPKTFIKIIKGETSKEKTILFITEDENSLQMLNEFFG